MLEVRQIKATDDQPDPDNPLDPAGEGSPALLPEDEPEAGAVLQGCGGGGSFGEGPGRGRGLPQLLHREDRQGEATTGDLWSYQVADSVLNSLSYLS